MAVVGIAGAGVRRYGLAGRGRGVAGTDIGAGAMRVGMAAGAEMGEKYKYRVREIILNCIISRQTNNTYMYYRRQRRGMIPVGGGTSGALQQVHLNL